MMDHKYPEEIKEDSWERVLRLFEIGYVRRTNGEKTDSFKITGEVGESTEERTDISERKDVCEDGWVKVHIRS